MFYSPDAFVETIKQMAPNFPVLRHLTESALDEIARTQSSDMARFMQESILLSKQPGRSVTGEMIDQMKQFYMASLDNVVRETGNISLAEELFAGKIATPEAFFRKAGQVSDAPSPPATGVPDSVPEASLPPVRENTGASIYAAPVDDGTSRVHAADAKGTTTMGVPVGEPVSHSSDTPDLPGAASGVSGAGGEPIGKSPARNNRAEGAFITAFGVGAVVAGHHIESSAKRRAEELHRNGQEVPAGVKAANIGGKAMKYVAGPALVAEGISRATTGESIVNHIRTHGSTVLQKAGEFISHVKR